MSSGISLIEESALQDVWYRVPLENLLRARTLVSMPHPSSEEHDAQSIFFLFSTFCPSEKPVASFKICTYYDDDDG